jgi:penicillin-binding protein
LVYGLHPRRNKLSSRTGGTSRAKNIWALVLDDAINKKPDYFPTKQFKRPENIVEMTVSGYSGKLPSEATAKSGHLVTDIFNRKDIPTEEDKVFVNLSIIPYNGINYIAQASTPAEFVREKTVIKREKSVSGILKQIQDIMQKVSPDRRRSIDHYRPLDYEDDAPAENDPRVDDGNVPVSPITVVATRTGDTSVITFQASSSDDTVGYRLYRSTNRGRFERLNGKVALSGEETKFTDQISVNGAFGYYVTAVDVAGKESLPSKASFTDGTNVDTLFLTPDESGAVTPPPVTGRDVGINSTGTNGTGNGNGTAVTPGNTITNNTPTQAKTIPESPGGLTVKTGGAGILLSWRSNPDKDKIKQYNIYFSNQENGVYSKLGTVSNGTEFRYYAAAYEGYYKVSAVNDIGESKQSAAVNFKK